MEIEHPCLNVFMVVIRRLSCQNKHGSVSVRQMVVNRYHRGLPSETQQTLKSTNHSPVCSQVEMQTAVGASGKMSGWKNGEHGSSASMF